MNEIQQCIRTLQVNEYDKNNDIPVKTNTEKVQSKDKQ
jgi:hypothetical protein